MTLIYVCATFCAPIWGAPATPDGVLNSLQGDVSVNGLPVRAFDAGKARLEVGGSIQTGEGMAEMLLTPGAFLRLGNRSVLNLEAAGPTDVRAKLTQGEALIEVVDLQAGLVVEQNGAIAVIRKPGLYDFNAKRARIDVYAGEAELKTDRSRAVAGKGVGIKAHDLREFKAAPNPGSALLAWSNLRSEQLSRESWASAAEASSDAAKPNSAGPAWYWNPWSASYTFLSASGFVTGPFGWPYYSPCYAPNAIPTHRGGDSYLYGLPVLGNQGPANPVETPGVVRPPTVPLTAPGVPQFPNNRFNSNPRGG